jgi:nitroreductase
MESYPFIPYQSLGLTQDESLEKIKAYYDYYQKRRSVRDYSDQPVPKELIEKIIMTASSAPSGANKQPWTFCAVSNLAIKKEIRKAAEEEEYKNYHGRMSDSWLKDLAPLGTDWHKEFLEIAPWLIVVFKKAFDFDEEGNKLKNYYVNESVGLACGFLLSAIHQAGLVSLTHTPSPMNFLEKILNRPDNERAFLLIPVGYASEDAKVPVITKKSESDVIVYFE